MVVVLLISAMVTPFDNRMSIKAEAASAQEPATTWSMGHEFTALSMTYGDDGTFTIGDITESYNYNNMFCSFAEPVDLFGAETMEFYFENNTGKTLGFMNITAKALLGNSTFDTDYASAGEFYNTNAPGALWYMPHDFNVAPMQWKPSGETAWVQASTDACFKNVHNNNTTSVLTIPSGWKGYIRMPLTDNDRTISADNSTHRYTSGVAFQLCVGYGDDENNENYYKKYSNTSFVLKDLKFTNSNGIAGKWQAHEYNGYGITFGTDGVFQFGTNPQHIYVKMKYHFSEPVDLYAADYMEFRFNNTTGLPLQFGNIGVSATIVTHDGGYKELQINGHNINLTKIQVKEDTSNEWKDADTTIYSNDYQSSVFTIPAGFSGKVRMPLYEYERTVNADGITHITTDGIALMLSTGYTDSTNSPAMSDYVGKSFQITDLDFTSNDTNKDGGRWDSVQYKFFNMNYGSDGTMTIGNPSDNINIMRYTFNKSIDLQEAKYVQFYFENKAEFPLAIANFGVDVYTENDEIKGLNHNFTTNPIEWLPDGAAIWSATDKTKCYGKNTNEVTNALDSQATFPAGWKGYVRIPLSESERMNETAYRHTNAIAITMYAGYQDNTEEAYCGNYAGQQFIIKDLDVTALNTNQVKAGWDNIEFTSLNLTYGDGGLVTIGNPSGNLNRMRYSFTETVDLYDKDYVQFYFDNQSGLPLAIGEIGVKALMGTDVFDTQYQSTSVWYQENAPHALWFIEPDYTKMEWLKDGEETWSKVEATTSFSGISDKVTFPAEWKGYVRIPLSEKEQTVNGDRKTHRYTNSIGINLYAGDGTSYSQYANKTFVIKDVSFTTNTTNELRGDWASYEFPLLNIDYGSDGTMTIGNNASYFLDRMCYTLKESADLYNAEYLQFYFENNTELPLGFAQVISKALLNGEVADNDYSSTCETFFGDYPNAVWPLPHDQEAYPVECKKVDAVEWIGADTSACSGGVSIATFPAGWKGYVRIPLSATERTLNGDRTTHRTTSRLFIDLLAGYESDNLDETQYTEYKGKSFVLRDLGFVYTVAGDSNSDELVDIIDLVRAKKSEQDKFVSYFSMFKCDFDDDSNIDSEDLTKLRGIILGDTVTLSGPNFHEGKEYDPNSDPFYIDNASIDVTWVNTYHGSTESWYSNMITNGDIASIDDYDGDGERDYVNNADPEYRKYLYNMATDAGIEVLCMDLTNGYSAWRKASKDYQRMAYENGTKFMVAVGSNNLPANDAVTSAEKWCQFVWEYYVEPGKASYSQAYLYKDGKPAIVFYVLEENYRNIMNNVTENEYLSKFTILFADGETSVSDKWGWQWEQGDTTNVPISSQDSMFVNGSNYWGIYQTSTDAWRCSLAWLDYTFALRNQANPKYTIVGCIDDMAERNGWLPMDTSTATFGGMFDTDKKKTDNEISAYALQTRDEDGDLSNDVFYKHVKSWLSGTVPVHASGGILADGAYTITGESDCQFGVVDPQMEDVAGHMIVVPTEHTTDVNATLVRELNTDGIKGYYWFYHLGNNVYRIIKLTSGLSIAATSEGQVVQQYTENNDYQKWSIIQNADGTYQIKNVQTGTFLSECASNGSNDTDNITVQSTEASSYNQAWTLTEKVRMQ